MSATNHQGGYKSLSARSPETINGNISKKVPDTRIFAPGYGKRKSDALMEKFTEECSRYGLTIFDEELSELEVYLDFLSRHVTTGKGCSVSCMMLWTEWAKFCKSQIRNYPVFLLEKEFSYLILNQFKLHPVKATSSGILYMGLQFVSDKKRYIESSVHPATSTEFHATTCG